MAPLNEYDEEIEVEEPAPKKKIDRHDDWQTPDAIFHPLDDIFRFNVDAAADEDNAKCAVFYTEQVSAFDYDWRHDFGNMTSVWCNPPYKDIAPWLEKANEECKRGATVVLLIPNSRDTKWYHDIIVPAKKAGYCRTYSYRGRIKFVDPNPGTRRQSPKQGNMLVVFTPPMPTEWSLD